MSVTEDETSAPGERDDGYRSPALSRLQNPLRKAAPIRQITEVGRQLTGEAAAAARLAAIEDRLARLEQQQLALVANLCEAHEAFRRLSERVHDRPERPAD